MNIAPDGTREAKVDELWDEIGGGTVFTHDDIVRMVAAAREAREDFHLVHRDVRYVVRISALDEYFSAHPTPEKPMKEAEKIKHLEAKLREANQTIFDLRKQLRGGAVVEDRGPVLDESPFVGVPASASVSARGLDVPLKSEPFENILSDLRSDLKARGVRPDVTNR